jgi:2'-hydroxyisoflavone reductase
VNRRDLLLIGTSALAATLLPRRALCAQTSKRILFLGGTGYIGPHIIHAALAKGHQVAMMNRGQREPNQNAADFARVEAIRGDRTLPNAYANLAGKRWDVVIDTANQVPWTREAVAALKGSTNRFLYISSTGVYFPYRTVNIAEGGPVLLEDTPPQTPPTFGVMKALSEQEVRRGMPGRDIIVRPGYIVGPGDTSDRFTYWPVRVSRGGEVLVPGRRSDPVQYVDVRDLADFIVRLIETNANGTYNVTGPAQAQTMAEFIEGLTPLAKTPVQYTWVDDYAWLKRYPLRKRADGATEGLTYAVPWILPEGDEQGHMQINTSKARSAGLTFRPLLMTARDIVAWRESPTAPESLRKQPRYVLTPEQEQAMLAAWKARGY